MKKVLKILKSLKSGISRINIKIKAGEETEINCQGPHIDEEELLNLFDKIDNIQSGDTLIIAGNIPNTLPDDVYERIIERLDGKDVRIVVDATKKLLVNSLKYKPFLIKPNRQELSEIFDTTVKTESDVVKYAQELQKMGAKNVLIKGGHFDGEPIDILLDEKNEVYRFMGKRINTKNTHGTGCTLSSAITANIAKGMNVADAVRCAKDYVTNAIKYSFSIGKGHGPTNHFYDYYNILENNEKADEI